MNRWVLMLLGLVAVIVLALVCALLHREAIESDLGARSRSALDEAGLGGVAMSIAGREVTLTGTVATAEESARAEELVENVYGVNSVDSRVRVEKPVPTPEPRTPPAQNSAPTEPLPPDPQAAARRCQAAFDANLAGGSSTAFASGRAELSAEGRELLARLAGVATTCPAAAIEVAGHTDASGSELLNQRLSQERAQAAVDYLVTLGIAAQRLRAVGYGESQPVADNASADGRARNRRIEITVREL